MSPARIQHLLARPDLDPEINALLRELSKSGGALAIADKAAWQTIKDECPVASHNEEPCSWWYASHPSQFELDLMDVEEEEIAQDVSDAINYLTSRDMLECDEGNAGFIRLKIEAFYP